MREGRCDILTRCLRFGTDGQTVEFHAHAKADDARGETPEAAVAALLAAKGCDPEPVPDADPASRIALVAAILREHYSQYRGQSDAEFVAELTRPAETGPDALLGERLEAAWKAVGGRE
jgi:hypothetical protein